MTTDNPDSREPTTSKVQLVQHLIEHLEEKMTIGERLEFFAHLDSLMVGWQGSAEDDLENYKDRNEVVS